MDVLSLDKFRQHGVFFLQHNGTQALQLAFLFPEDVHLVLVFHLGADVGNQQFETLVEDRLRRNVELDGRHVLFLQGNIQEYVLETKGCVEEILLLIHIRRIQPHHGVLGEQAQQTLPFFLPGFPGGDVRVNIGLGNLLDGKLCVTVEGMDLIYLVAEETDAVGMFQRIGEDVYHRAAYGKLAGSAHKVHLFKTLLNEPPTQILVVHLLAHLYGKKGVG